MKHIWNKKNKVFGIVNLTVGMVMIYKVFDYAKMQIKQMEKLS